MGTIKVRFKWKAMIRVSKNRTLIKKVSTGTMYFTFDQIRQIHACNYKGIGTVRRGYAYLTDNRGYAVKLTPDEVRKKVEASDDVYEVELNNAWLSFTPILRNEKEQNRFGNDLYVQQTPMIS